MWVSLNAEMGNTESLVKIKDADWIVLFGSYRLLVTQRWDSVKGLVLNKEIRQGHVNLVGAITHIRQGHRVLLTHKQDRVTGDSLRTSMRWHRGASLHTHIKVDGIGSH